ncbi:RGCVC family protein [Actinokineospora sp. NBRC 105648]|uniref:RGCVC family protein n=1 Tax=Actinokineospora sp. NBRC 105648 TaxID=3032206 RepID=UPI0024A5AE7E|nr:RGCVC family protein [Actinokineospora sp. NBRC 105648]GLZ36959.1 hypothetical protein Acsp05_05840 [Actinokineospora sp. NBRC 105648]
MSSKLSTSDDQAHTGLDHPPQGAVAQAESGSPPETGTDASCVACPHDWADHDRISARYCTATAAGEQTRGCVCKK